MAERISNILDAMASPHLFARWFKDPSTWAAARAFLSALFHLPIDAEARAIYETCTGRSQLPVTAFDEAWLICGRRGGKSLLLAMIAVFLAIFRDWRPYLVPGERGVIMIIAQNRLQGRVIFSYIKAFLTEAPSLAQYVENITRERIDLAGDISIEVHTCSYRSIRGRTVIVGLCDELAMWDTDDDAAEPDYEVLSALRPAMSSVRGALLLCASSPHAQRGELWKAYQEFYGKDSDVLVWKADTRTMNPTIAEKMIASAYRRDPVGAAANYGAEFRSDADGYVSREVVEAAVAKGVFERAPAEGVVYTAFCDPAGGSGKDAMTMAVAHHEGGQAVLDCIRSRRPPFSPAAVCEEFAATLRWYGISTIEGDRFAGDWAVEGFERNGISYRQCGQTKSEIYQELLPALNSGMVVLLDLPNLLDELVALERTVVRGGRDKIDHGHGQHDDMINSAAGALVPAVRPAWDPPDEAFEIFDEGSVGAQLFDLRQAGIYGTNAMMAVKRLTPPWERQIR
jgi:hypothetical protein